MLLATFRGRAGIVVVGLDPFFSVATVIVSFACNVEVAEAIVCCGIANGELLVVFDKV